MSWFSDLTSKAEALLEKLDHDAARALQEPQNLLASSNLLDQAKRNIGYIIGQEDESQSLVGSDDNINEVQYEDATNTTEPLEVETSQPDFHEKCNGNGGEKGPQESRSSQLTPNAKIDEVKTHILQSSLHIPLESGRDTTAYRSVDDEYSDHPGRLDNKVARESPNSNFSSRRFKLQKSNLKRVNNNRSNAPSDIISSTTSPPKTEEAPGAVDIRASIDQSLREYALRTSSDQDVQQRPEQRSFHDSQTTIQDSFFDDQPNIIEDHQFPEGLVPSLADRRNMSSDSISITVPDRSNSSDIANQILRQSVKSKFNLHQVINRLAKQNNKPYKLIDERTKMRLRRVQMRVASYMRRLNYYFRVYPNLKYWMIVYLIILQLLVVYVLFFYQSSSSSTYLSSQVREQEDLSKSPSAQDVNRQSALSKQRSND